MCCYIQGMVLIVLLYSWGVTTFKGMVLICGLLHSDGVTNKWVVTFRWCYL